MLWKISDLEIWEKHLEKTFNKIQILLIFVIQVADLLATWAPQLFFNDFLYILSYYLSFICF